MIQNRAVRTNCLEPSKVYIDCSGRQTRHTLRSCSLYNMVYKTWFSSSLETKQFATVEGDGRRSKE